MLKRLFVVLGVLAFIMLAPVAYVYANTYVNDWVGVNTEYASSALLQENPAPLAKPVTLRVVTFNIQDLLVVARDHEERMVAIARKLGTLDPDIVGFQEAFIEKHRDLLTSELQQHTRLKHFQYYPSAKMGSGLLTASAFPIQEVYFHRYKDSNPWYKVWEGDYWAGKGVGLARIELPDGGLVDFFNTHAQAGYGVPANRDIRELQMASMGDFIAAARVPTLPAFAVGDLNSRIGSAEYNAVVNRANLLRTMNMDSSIDHILVVNDPAYTFEVLHTEEISEQVTSNGKQFYLSDHPGYLSEVRISPKAALLESSQ